MQFKVSSTLVLQLGILWGERQTKHPETTYMLLVPSSLTHWQQTKTHWSGERLCLLWVCFDGSQVLLVLASYQMVVSSVTRNPIPLISWLGAQSDCRETLASLSCIIFTMLFDVWRQWTYWLRCSLVPRPPPGLLLLNMWYNLSGEWLTLRAEKIVGKASGCDDNMGGYNKKMAIVKL